MKNKRSSEVPVLEAGGGGEDQVHEGMDGGVGLGCGELGYVGWGGHSHPHLQPIHCISSVCRYQSSSEQGRCVSDAVSYIR